MNRLFYFIFYTTLLLDKQKYDFEFIKNLYHKRWTVELFYKILNSVLKLKSSSMETLNTLQQDVFCKLIIIVLGKIIKLIIMQNTTVPLKKTNKLIFPIVWK